MYIGAIDIGGSKTIVGIVNEKGEVAVSKKMPTLKDPLLHFKETSLALSECLLKTGLTANDLLGLGVVLPGMVSKNVLLYAPALDWRNLEIAKTYSELCGIKNVRTQGDVNACAVAEAYFGGFGDLFWVTVSNGIGGAIITHGKLYKGANDVAGEIGHVKVEYGKGEICSCGQRGCAEAMASGTGIGKMVKKAADKYPEYKEMYIKKNLPLTAEGCAALAKENDEISIAIFDKAGIYIGRALSAALNLLDPGRVFIGGGVSLSLELLLPSIKRTVAECCMEFNAKASIEKTRLGYNAALLGAAALVLAPDMY